MQPNLNTVWHIAYTNPRCEAEAIFHLGRAGYRAFAPHCYESQKPDPKRPGARIQIKRWVFPRYVFVGVIDGRGLWEAANARGVGRNGLLQATDGPAIVRPKFMAKLMGRCEGDGWMRAADTDEPSHNFQVGDEAKIVAGSMEGLIVQVARLDGRDHVEVELDMFGAKRPVKLSASGLAPLAVERP